MANHKARSLPVCGRTSGDPSPFHWSSTILKSNTSVRSRPSTYYKRYKNIISAWSKKKGKDTVDSPLSGITQAKRCISQCQHTSKMLSSASSTRPPKVPQNQPHPHVHKTYRAKMQHATAPDVSIPLNKLGKKFIQEVAGVFLFLVRAVVSTMLTRLSALTSEQAAPTEKKTKNVYS